MEIKTIAVIGAGAVGCYFIDGFSKTPGIDMCVIAEGERKERLEKNGLMINGKQVLPEVKTPEEAEGADLLIVAVKFGALKEASEAAEKIADDHTIVLCPLNGVSSEQILAEKIPAERIICSMMKITSKRIDNHIRFDPESTPGIFFGEDNGSRSERIEALIKLFEKTGIHYHLSKNIIQDIWYKYALNISKNLPQAIINCGLGAYSDSEHLAYISKKMRDEVAAVALAKGIDIRDESSGTAKSSKAVYETRYSTLQDLDAKRPTEIDMFSGELVKMGKELGVPTPFNDFAYHAIKCLEEKNAGLIR